MAYSISSRFLSSHASARSSLHPKTSPRLTSSPIPVAASLLPKNSSSSSSSSHRNIQQYAIDPRLSAISDQDLVSSSSTLSPSVSPSAKVVLPPRLCTLREFGDGMVAVDDVDSASETNVSNFFQSLAANIELSAKVQDWEILSGRLAMVVFASAVVAEAVTGNSLFEKMDPQRLLGICLAILTSSLMAAGFAFALEAKTRVAYSFSKGYENLMNSLIDKVFDTLLFDNDEE